MQGMPLDKFASVSCSIFILHLNLLREKYVQNDLSSMERKCGMLSVKEND